MSFRGKIILASDSPRRRSLLREAGYVFDVLPPLDVDESRLPSESPEDFVRRLARLKAESVAASVPEGVIIGCDTVVVCHGEILGKPRDLADARRMLTLLRNEEHVVLSGICLLRRPEGTVLAEIEETRLKMLPIDDAELESYLATGLWKGKAGAFGLQDRTGWIEIVVGSPSNVVGLPLERLAAMLETLS